MDVRALADEDLIPLMARGDARAFETVYERHSGAAYSLAYRMVGDRVMAEDVSQEAFLSIWRSRMRYDASRGSVRTWVLGIVHNRAKPTARRAKQPARRSRDVRGAVNCVSSTTPGVWFQRPGRRSRLVDTASTVPIGARKRPKRASLFQDCAFVQALHLPEQVGVCLADR